MHKHAKGVTAVVFSLVSSLITLGCFNSFANITNFVAACDEGGKVYVADWIAASNRFDNFRRVATLHDSEGEYSYVRGIAVGDFNGDGYDDIVAARRIYQNRGAVHLLLNDGSNNFIIGRAMDFPYSLNDWVMDGCAGDFNNDGIDDFTFNGNNNYMHIWTSNGEGGFDYAEQSNLRNYGRATDCADFNNDGILDIFRNAYSSGNWSQYLEGNGDGTFKAPVDFYNYGGDPYGNALADFDGDGDIDRISNDGGAGDTYFYENTGTLFFADSVYVPSLDFNNHGSFDSFDYDDDGFPDIVVTDYTWYNLRYFRSNGDGTFTNSVTVGTLPASTMAVSAPPLPPLASHPSAVATPMVQTVAVNAAASFDCSSSSSLNGVLVSNRWDFGDGDVTPWLPAAVTSTSHVYTVEGHYRPRLYILDVEGYGAMRTVDVFVAGAAPAVAADELLLGESDAVGGKWPVDLPVTNFVSDAEGISSYCWAVSNIIDIGFEDGIGGNWFAQDGTWVVTNSHSFSGAKCYRQLNTTADRTRNFLETEIEGDFIFEVDCMAVGGTGQEIILNLNGHGWYNTYDIILRGRGNNDIRIDRIVDNYTYPQYNNFLGFVLTNNVPVHAEIHRTGSEITVFVNGNWVASMQDGTWTKGRIGLGTSDSDVIFDNVKVHLIGCNKDFTTSLEEGSHELTITASDGALQSTNVNVNIVCTNDGTPPTADAGTDISMDESAVTNNLWLVQLDGSGSIDAQTATTNLSYHWNPGLETFDGQDMDEGVWYISSSVYQTNQVVVPYQGGWGTSYAVTRHTVERSACTVFQARIRNTGETMAGFFHTSGFSYSQMPYAFYFNNSYMRIYEDGAQRRFVQYLNMGYYYDVRIVLKPDQGARYYMRQADIGAPWVLVYDSDYSSASNLRRGVTLAGGTAYVDDFDLSMCGESPVMPFYGTGTRMVELTVTDPAGNSDTDSVQVILSGNNPPVADAGPGPVLGEADAVFETWTVNFDASGSTDDYGIMLYEWDWDYDGAFDASGDEGVNQSHQWTEAGVYNIALRVTDHTLQTAMTNITVTITGGTDPVAAPGGPYYFDESNAVAGVWIATLDGSGSTDAETPTNELIYAWGDGTDTFDGVDLSEPLWYTSSAVYQTNQVIIPYQGGWGYAYAVTRHTVQREPGTRFQARIRSTGSSMAGFFHTSGFNYTQMPYAFYFAGGAMYIYEDGGQRGYFRALNTGYYYDVRIELKPTLGARYFMRQADVGAEWTLIYDSSHSSASNLRRGITLYDGTAYFDDFVDDVYGVMPQLPLVGEGDHLITLTVTDLAGNTDSNRVTVTTAANNPPVANAGSDVILGEVDAVSKIWTVNFDASASTDDFGIYKYEWDWDYSGTFNPSGDEDVALSRQWTEAGVYNIALRVTDHALQSNVTNITVTISGGTDPVADHGGPYYFDEFSGNASNGYWNVVLDASGTVDNESTNLTARWSLGNDPLDDERLLDLKWVHDAGTIITNGMLRMGADGANHYAYTREVFPRIPGLRAEARLRTSLNSEQAFGFKSNDGGTSWGNIVYGVSLDNGQIVCWEKGVVIYTSIPYNLNEWYDFRVELKEGAGAYYYYKSASTNAWNLIRETSSHSDTLFRRGFIKYSGITTFEADSYHEWAAGTNVNYKLYLHHLGTNDVELTVVDQALNSDTVNTTLTCMTNEYPVASFYPSALGLNESQAVNGIWEVPFSAMQSSDDHGIYLLEWDLDYDENIGFMPGSTSPTLVRQYTAPGTYPVALRVTDHLLQQDMLVGQIVCNAGTNPVAVIPSSYTVEKGWAVEFDGTASTDDSGVTGYEWEFGDGTTGSGARPKHVYRAETNVLLRLRVFDGVGQASDWVTATVAVVTSTLPTADAGSDYTGAAGGPPVYFDGSGSTDNGNPNVIQGVARYNWDIDIATDSSGDGNPSNDVDYVVGNPFHTYAASGVYTSRLVVVDGPGQSDVNDAVVTIVADLPPDVICVPWHGDINQFHKAVSGEPVTLKAVVRDAGALTHQWLFGDGNSTSVSPIANKYAVETTHVYNGVPGQPFTATLRVWDANGNRGTDTYLVKIAPADDATRADIAIDNGLWWLHKDQNKTNGRWTSSYGGYYACSDSSALLALQINAHRLLGNPMEDPYVETVRLGFRDLFNLLQTDVMTLQNGNDPDTNGNGIGIRSSGSHAGYQSGMVMDAIAASRELLAVSATGTSTDIKHRYFLDILTDMVDEYSWGQHDSGGMRGGWRYDMNGGADNSAAQWGAIGLLAAKDMFGINIPQFVIDENKIWLNYSRNGANYGYDGPNPAWGWHSVTPSAMVQMCLDGIQTTNPVWTVTEDQMRNVWPIESMASKHYYANYAFVKAMRSAKPAPVVQMHQDGFDWYADPVEGIRVKVTGQQDADGSWYAYAQQGSGYPLYRTMSTSWAIAMLTPSLFSVPPVAVIDTYPHWPYDRDLVLDGSQSYHPDESLSIVRYSWDLNGDGIYTVITNEPYAVINVPDQGSEDTIVTVKLRVTDDNDPAVSSVTFVQIRFSNGPFPPFAVPGDSYLGYAEVPFTVDGSASWDLDSDNIVQYMWDFNNDGTNDLITAVPTGQWIYDDVGEYTAALRVVDDGVPGMNTSLWEFVAITIEEPPLYPLPEGLDSTNRVWITGGDGVWTGQIVRTHDTIDAGGTPAITDLQSVWFETTVDGPGTITFWWKTSSEEYFDWLYFYVDGTLNGGISGETAWHFVSFAIDDDASHTLRWEYRKDKTLSAGRDEGYVDQVVWTSTGLLTGFAAFLDQYGLTGASMSTMGTDDHIAYGFEYTLGFSPVVSNDVSLIGFSHDGGVRFVDTPMQDTNTIPYIDYKVKATINLLDGTWPLELTPTNHPAVPGGRTWWMIPGGYPTMFFKLWAEEK